MRLTNRKPPRDSAIIIGTAGSWHFRLWPWYLLSAFRPKGMPRVRGLTFVFLPGDKLKPSKRFSVPPGTA